MKKFRTFQDIVDTMQMYLKTVIDQVEGEGWVDKNAALCSQKKPKCDSKCRNQSNRPTHWKILGLRIFSESYK